MGIGSWLKRRAGTEKTESTAIVAQSDSIFILKQYWNRQWIKVEEWSLHPTDEELRNTLEAGKYRIDELDSTTKKFKKFGDAILVQDPETGIVPVSDNPTEGKGRKSRSSMIGQLSEEIDGLVEEKKQLDGTLLKVATLFGGGSEQKPQKTLLEQLKDEQNTADEYAKIFGYTKGQGGKGPFEGVPVDGHLPALAVYGPEIFDRFADRFERRLERMGVIEGEGSGGGRKINKEVEEKVEKSLPEVNFSSIPVIDSDAVRTMPVRPKPQPKIEPKIEPKVEPKPDEKGVVTQTFSMNDEPEPDPDEV